MLVRWGPFRWWRGLRVTTDNEFVTKHFEAKFYGIGFWMVPYIVGWTRWQERERRQQGEQEGE